MEEVLIIAGFILEALVLLVGAVWAVARINTTALVLNTNLNHLTSTMKELHLLVKKMDDKLDNHETRITVLEQQKG